SHLRAQAIEYGAKLLTNARAINRRGKDVLVEFAGKIFHIRAKIIVGADGPRSRVACWMGNEPPELYVGVQRSIKLLSGLSPELYFSPVYGSGYGWMFPKGDRANVGVSVPIVESRRLKGKLDAFCEQLARNGKIDKERVYSATGGLIPVGGPPRRTVYKNMLLVGDAGGQTNPLTGSGIAPAVICGRMAGKWAAKAALQNNPALLRHYDDEWKSLYSDSLSRALKFRREIENNRTSPHFYTLIKKAWGFR
ncbi:NAD(P)/FAD-dependent oxidoreductase, partial [Candidatus Sumerlaeota bacterium]|nr:NAD(P)/FAD-dependent oxidoreductase [Candidatus Sumerlaeota bacterium]